MDIPEIIERLKKRLEQVRAGKITGQVSLTINVRSGGVSGPVKVSVETDL